MLVILILAVLLAVVLSAVWLAYQDLKRRDRLPPPMPPQNPAVPLDVWPPPPRRDQEGR